MNKPLTNFLIIKNSERGGSDKVLINEDDFADIVENIIQKKEYIHVHKIGRSVKRIDISSFGKIENRSTNKRKPIKIRCGFCELSFWDNERHPWTQCSTRMNKILEERKLQTTS